MNLPPRWVAALVDAGQAAGPSVVQICADDLAGPASFAALLRTLRDMQADLRAGALVSMDLHRQRLRLLPLGRN